MWGGALLLAACFFVTGCNNLFNIEKKTESVTEYVPITQRVDESSLTSNTTKSVFRLVSAVESAVHSVAQYVEVPDATRSIAQLSLQDIGLLLPEDISSLKRNIPATGSERSAAGDGATTTITLEEELNAIVADYNVHMAALVPSFEGVTLPDGIRVQDGIIYLSDDETVPQYSLAGIATAELLIAIANGNDGVKAAERISSEIETLFESDSTDDGRALYIKPFSLWAGNTVNYRWGSINGVYKDAVLRAMNDWSTASGGKVRFSEYSDTVWNNFLLAIGNTRVVRIEEFQLKPGVGGEAHVGAVLWGLGYLRLRPGLTSVGLVRVTLHELGHTLGLQHEHQRADRDTYVDVNAEWHEFVNFGKLPEITISTGAVRVLWRSRRVWLVTIWYPVVEYYTEHHPQFQKTAWDFDSVMLYPDLPIKAPHANLINGQNSRGDIRTKWNLSISSKDAELIRRLY